MSLCAIIPARYASSRYPGKPLVPLLGRPMILWVAELAAEAIGREHAYVATDDARIADVVKGAGYRALMTRADCLTGTDRLADAARQVAYDAYVNVQGDEPLVRPADILKVAEAKARAPHAVWNGYAPMGANEDPHSPNVPKVVAAADGRLLYMSRAALPAHKDPAHAPSVYMKQVCIYAFSRDDLEAFAAAGKKGSVEASEDIEILRFLELGREVRMIETEPGSLAVDTPEDVGPVEAALAARGQRA